jgi:hypothetical protein
MQKRKRADPGTECAFQAGQRTATIVEARFHRRGRAAGKRTTAASVRAELLAG